MLVKVYDDYDKCSVGRIFGNFTVVDKRVKMLLKPVLSCINVMLFYLP